MRPAAGTLLTICFHTGQLTAQAVPFMHVLDAWLSTSTFISWKRNISLQAARTGAATG